MSDLLAPGWVAPVQDHLPPSWSRMRLSDACTFQQGGKLGLTKEGHYTSSGAPAYSAAGQDGFVERVEFKDTNAVILSAIGANCGRCFLASGDFTTLANTQVIIPNPCKLDARFLKYRVNREGYWPRSGSAQPFIKPKDMKNCWIALPDVGQQSKIAEVLDTLDAAIRGTEAVVAKLRAMKQGLQHDLLTRGIDANGDLRPPHPAAPHLYHKTPLGWLPKEWEVDHLSCFASIHGGKRLPAGHSYADGTTGFKYLRVTDFFGKGFKTSDLENLEEVTFRALERYEITAGQLYISIAGSLGHVGVFPESDDGETRTILTENAARIVLNRAGSPRFLSMMMNSVPVQQQVEWEKGTGGGVPKLALFRIAQFYIGFPHPSEQDAITAAFDELCHRESVEQALLDKLRLQKSGLMDDLLTGRVPVTPLL